MASSKTLVVYIFWMVLYISTSKTAFGAQRESSKPKEQQTSTASGGGGSSSSSGGAGGVGGVQGSSANNAALANISGGSISGGGTKQNNIEIEEPKNGPYFDKAASKNVTALLGKTAYLNCRVKNLGNKTMVLQVSWVRHRDIHLLTVGRYTYTSDQRFRAIHHAHSEDWILQIKYPQHRDSGIYECQVSTQPHISHYIQLNVVEPSTEIIGAPDLYIESGSTINLTCVVLNSPEPPAYIFWNHNNAIISYDSPRGGVTVITEKGETTTSFLLIKNARPSDSGHYQCNPSNAKSKSVLVHVLNGVSHSVSRGVPSSNAARGPTSSSDVTATASLNFYINFFLLLTHTCKLHIRQLICDITTFCYYLIINIKTLLINNYTKIIYKIRKKIKLFLNNYDYYYCNKNSFVILTFIIILILLLYLLILLLLQRESAVR